MSFHNETQDVNARDKRGHDGLSSRNSPLPRESGKTPTMIAVASSPKTSYRWLVLAAATFAQASASFAMLGVAALADFLQQQA